MPNSAAMQQAESAQQLHMIILATSCVLRQGAGLAEHRCKRARLAAPATLHAG
jgi:hypothetical protein